MVKKMALPSTFAIRVRNAGIGLRYLALLMMIVTPMGCATTPLNTTQAPQQQTSSRSFDILHYVARIEPDIVAKSVRGRIDIHWVAADAGLLSIELDNDGLEVQSARELDQALMFEQRGRRLSIQLSSPTRTGEKRVLRIHYRGAPAFGMQFYPERQQVYTIFSTAQWLIGIDAPDERATLDLSVVLPSAMRVVANGNLVEKRKLSDNKTLSRWQLKTPVPAYTFGFAAGPFNEVTEQRGKLTLRYLAEGFSETELGQLFEESGDMLDYFAQRAGVPYPGDSYTQALVADTIGQEMAGFSLLSEAYGKEVLADRHTQSLLAHEAAHQWWGNQITCRDWNHFWLNEGLATFLAATYIEHRFGRAQYLAQVALWRQRYERLRVEHADKSLVFPNWDHPTSNDRAVVYQKGAYVLHLLREQLGEKTFWRGIRSYTRHHFGHSVATEDFQRSMQSVATADLAPFFDRWVYAASAPAGAL
jgi:aminopeptidase N